jgi:hypothetical protein
LNSRNDFGGKMKKIITLAAMLVFASHAFGHWTTLYDRNTPLASYYVGDELTTIFEFGINTDTGSWTIDYGLGTSTDGTSWAWYSAVWSRMDGESNRVWKSVANDHTFSAAGTYYYAGRFETSGYIEYASDDWSENRTSLSATSYFTVSALVNPSSVDATASSSTQIDLSWTKWNSKDVLVVRNTTGSFTAPTNGTGYTAGNIIGVDVVVYNGALSEYDDTELDANTTYYYKYYSVNNDYYSSGATDNDQSLPVELSLWTAQSKSGNVFLNWTTDSEIENLGFIIERKGQNQKSYQEIASYLSYDALKGQGSSTQVTEYHFIDKAVEVGQTYFYRLTDIDYQGKRTGHAEISVVVKAADEKMLADHFRVKSCYPNPFNPSTTISYELTEAMTVTLHIFDVQGREIYSQVSEPQSAGTYEVQWNGKDANGGALNSGIYIARLEAGANYSQSLKLIYLQ